MLFDESCRILRMATPSQVVRRMIRTYIEERTGQPWTPPEETPELAARCDTARRKDVSDIAGYGAIRSSCALVATQIML
jgi:hypothetical protein